MLFHFKTIINKNVLVIHNMGFPGGSAGKESTCNAGDLGLIPGLLIFLDNLEPTQRNVQLYIVHGEDSLQLKLILWVTADCVICTKINRPFPNEV